MTTGGSWAAWCAMLCLVWPAKAYGQPADTLPGLSLRLNVAARRLDLLAEGGVVVSHSTAVGTPEYPTPRGEFTLSAVEWNPWWIPPAREWTKGQHPTPPGPTNPMGRVKLHFRPLYFFHGTPAESSIGTAASHGCVRLRNPDAIALATRVMIAGISGLDSAQVALISADSATSTWLLEQPIPVSIVYQTIELEGDTLRLHPDVYSLGLGATLDLVVSQLESRRVPAAEIDSAEVRHAVAASRHRSIAVPLGLLVRPTRTPGQSPSITGSSFSQLKGHVERQYRPGQ